MICQITTVLTDKELYLFLEENYRFYNQRDFIGTDPISIPHQFTREEDIEIAGLLSATLAWGNREVIIRNAGRLVSKMPGGPREFLLNATSDDFLEFLPFVHRTFNGQDCVFFLQALADIYRNKGGLKQVFYDGYKKTGNIPGSILHFHDVFFGLPHLNRTRKHIPNPSKGSAAKRILMFLRWMVRKDDSGVDFGFWEEIPSSSLYIPLDLHSGKVARELGLLKRKQNDWKAVEELTSRLRQFDGNDPVKYDFALFGLSAFRL